jgi:adenine C2-methylase RlmN of 23S rRNA A2503 and tRNA A37
MNIEKLEKVLANEPKFRLKQTKEAVFQKFISSWNEASFLPKDLREKLNKDFQLKQIFWFLAPNGRGSLRRLKNLIV